MLKITSSNTKIGEKIETYWLRRAKLMIILRIRPRNKKIWPGEIQNFENQEIHMVVHAPSVRLLTCNLLIVREKFEVSQSRG